MAKIKDGGPAFPSEQGHTSDGSWNQTYEPGMSLRDHLAAQALNGWCANNAVFAANGMCGWSLVNCEEADLARMAYAMADAMLTARQGGPDA